MDTYIRELKNHIQHFEFHLSQFDALDQPAYSQRRNLKASMELYEKTQYIPSSNWLSPGRDIAIAFCDAKIMRLLMSGARLYDHKTKRYFKSSPQVTELFKNNPLIQKSMGYHKKE
ncbi:hypothetical protein PSTG_08123 [Puccinia striiformis f. sp. tritici PST-78]|uniref:Uncharacterized protein n=1 Tax=Puccinia striiformis f. sp. tritici PST-78 TaxID=1165861 RepID=A0A0L0VH20_9BASI|nr:hypothetical protein PSTG_08123 [Puccinia striiformis f. sp. tritici PST-78]